MCKAWRDLPALSIRRDPAAPGGTLVQWPAMDGHVRFYLDIAALVRPAIARHTLTCEVTIDLLPLGRPVDCEWLALLRRNSKGWYLIHRKIAENLRFTREDTRRRWTIRISSDDVETAGPLLLGIQMPGAAASFRLDQVGIRVQSVESDVAAFTTCLGGMLEGWTRLDDATLSLDASPGAGLPVGYGRFSTALPRPAAASGAAGRACVMAGGDIVAYLDLSSLPADGTVAPADDAPSEDALSPRAIEWLHDRGRFELLWTLGDGLEAAAPTRYAFDLYGAAAFLTLNAAESAYVGLREATGPNPAFPDLPPDIRRAMRLRFARACLRSGRTPEAEAVLQEMVAADPFDWECYFHLATIVSDDAPALRHTYLQIADALAEKPTASALTVLIEDQLARGCIDEAWVRALRELKARGLWAFDLWLALANVHLARGDRLNWSANVRRMFAAHRLAEPEFEVTRDPAEDVFHRLGAPADLAPSADQRHLITVIMTTYNAERTVKGAVQSVLAQSYRNLRLVVVDDCSTDDTMLLLRGMQERDGRIEILQAPVNAGTYCAKNMALSRFESDYYTFHDSDDWMHPERLAIHHAAMQADPRVMCSTSRWFRMDARGAAAIRRSGGYLHDNPASTFFHRAVVERIGYFDSVRTGADTELVQRIRRRFGPASTTTIAKPLAIGLHHSSSLTRSGLSAFNEHRYSAPRVAYWESWVAWHREAVLKGTEAQELYLPFPHHPRRFPAPEEIMPDGAEPCDTAALP